MRSALAILPFCPASNCDGLGGRAYDAELQRTENDGRRRQARVSHRRRKLPPARRRAAARGLPPRLSPLHRRAHRCCAASSRTWPTAFPALLFALVTGYATPSSSASAPSSSSATGAPLREAADALGLAWWLRRLPAQAFTAPLPAFPLDRDFSFRIANLIPRDERRVADLARAREPCLRGRRTAPMRCGSRASTTWPARRRTCSRSWRRGPGSAGSPGLLGHRLLRRPWTPEMSFKRAREELAAWRQRLRLIECLGPGIESPWLADGTAAGFDFVALRTVDDFIAESEALENCLDQYADQLHTGLTAVFSIRKGARRVACVEIGLHDEEVTMPDHRAAARAPATAGRRRRSGRRPTAGSAASASSRCRRCAMRPSR